MPIKEYLCTNCGSTSELIIGIGRSSDESLCKSCGSAELQELISAPAPPLVSDTNGLTGDSTCCGGTPPANGCIPGSCCGNT